jgi:hypothetical protein
LFIVLASLLLIAWMISFFCFAGAGLQRHFICMTTPALRGLWGNLLILVHTLDLDSSMASPCWEADYLRLQFPRGLKPPRLSDPPFCEPVLEPLHIGLYGSSLGLTPCQNPIPTLDYESLSSCRLMLVSYLSHSPIVFDVRTFSWTWWCSRSLRSELVLPLRCTY